MAFIDLGADFRLKEESDYAQWYGGAYTHQELHSQAVYALPELFRAAMETGTKINVVSHYNLQGVPLTPLTGAK